MQLNKADTRKLQVISPHPTNVKRRCIPSPKAWAWTGKESSEVIAPQALGSYNAWLDFLEMPEPRLSCHRHRAWHCTLCGKWREKHLFQSPTAGLCWVLLLAKAAFSHEFKHLVFPNPSAQGVSQYPRFSLSVLVEWMWEVGGREEISSPARSPSWVEIEALKVKEIWMVWPKFNILEREWWRIKLESYFRIMKGDKWLNFGQKDCHPPDSDMIVPWIFF